MRILETSDREGHGGMLHTDLFSVFSLFLRKGMRVTVLACINHKHSSTKVHEGSNGEVRIEDRETHP